VPSIYYIDPDATLGVPDAASGLTKLDPNAAVAADHVNLTDSGYAGLTTAYLNALDTWQLNDDGTTALVAADTAENDTSPYLAGNDATGNSPAALTATGATWATDTTRGAVLALNGTTGGASAAGPVFTPSTTSGSYSVSAWAKLTSNAANATVATQEGATNAPFSLRYDKALNAWTYSVSTTSTGTGIVTMHGTAPTLNAWYHLVATYNATSHQMNLYVNGTSVGSPASFTTPWYSTGTFDIGHAGSTSWFPGSLSDVQAWNYALSATQVTALDQQVS
jgi:hypothetical protein